MAHNIGDSLTYWILDDQSKQVLARSVVCPFYENHHVKWDPTLIPMSKHTAHNGGDLMPSGTERKMVMDNVFDTYDLQEPEIPPTEVFYECIDNPQNKSVGPILHHDCDNPGLDTSQLTILKDNFTTKMTSKLCLDNEPLAIDEDIPYFPRKGKKPYKEVTYPSSYKPKEFVSPMTHDSTTKCEVKRENPRNSGDQGDEKPTPLPRKGEIRRSEHLKGKTKWNYINFIKQALHIGLTTTLTLPTTIMEEPAVDLV